MLQGLKRSLTSWHFVGAVLLLFISFSGFAACDWLFIYNWDISYRASSLQQTIGGIFFGGVMLMIPLGAAIPAGINQVDELQTGFIKYEINRSSVSKYTIRQLTISFLAAGSAVGLAFFLHAVLWNILATPCDPRVNEYLAIPFSEDCIYYPWQGICYSLPIYIWMTAALFFCGGIWGIISTTAALFTQDKLLAVAIPFCLYFLWHYGLPGVLLGIREFPHPADLYNDALTVAEVWRSIAVYLSILAVCIVFYLYKIKRSIYDEK